MKYFVKSEFYGNYENIDPRLLVALDIYRELLQKPVYISPTEGAIVRQDNSNSQHNILRYKQSRAIDIFPAGEPWDSFICALQIPEIKGIGLYPYWSYQTFKFGMHLDVRESRNKIIWWQNELKEYNTIHSLTQFQGVIDAYRSRITSS